MNNIILTRFGIKIMTRHIRVSARYTLTYRGLRLTFLIRPVTYRLPAVRIYLLSLTMMYFRLVYSRGLRSLTLNRCTRVNEERYLLSLNTLRFRLYLALQTSAFIHVLIRDPDISTIRTNNLSILRLGNVIIGAFARYPLRLHSLSESWPLI